MQRSLYLFENAIRTKASYQIYKYGLDKFVKLFKIKNYDSLLKIDDKKLQEMVEDYVIFLKKGNPNSVRSYYSGVELFFVINDKALNWKKIRKFFPRAIQRTGKDAWSTTDIKRMLQGERSLRNRAVVHVLASTGVRVGALPDLRIKHVKSMPLDCKAVLIYEGDLEEYWTFLTPEASKALDEYLDQRERDGEHLNEHSPVFRKHYQIGNAKVKPVSIWGIKAIVPKLVKNASLVRDKTGNRYNVQSDHGFRKRFNTILKKNKNIPHAINERLMGHRQDLDAHYLSMSKDELFEFFQKGIAELTISDEGRQKAEITRKAQRITELEKQKDDMNELQAKVRRLEDMINNREKNLDKLEKS